MKREAVFSHITAAVLAWELAFCGVGCLIGWLLNYAGGKGEKKHESEK